jgi:hypothetical protein
MKYIEKKEKEKYNMPFIDTTNTFDVWVELDLERDHQQNDDEELVPLDDDVTQYFDSTEEIEQFNSRRNKSTHSKFVFEFAPDFIIDDDDSSSILYGLQKTQIHKTIQRNDDDDDMSDISDSVADNSFCSLHEVLKITMEDAVETEQLMREYATRMPFIQMDTDIMNGAQLMMSLTTR